MPQLSRLPPVRARAFRPPNRTGIFYSSIISIPHSNFSLVGICQMPRSRSPKLQNTSIWVLGSVLKFLSCKLRLDPSKFRKIRSQSDVQTLVIVRVAFVRACLLPAQTTATPHAHCFRFLFRYSFAVCCLLVLVEQRPRTEDGTCIHWTTVIHCPWCVIVGPRRAFVQFKNLARQDLNVVHSVALC